MIDVKQAVSTAVEALKNLYGELSDLLLEEVDRSDDGKYWLITLGFSSPNQVPQGNPLNPLLQLGATLRPPIRIYRVITVNADTGEFVSMKIREALAA